MENSDLGSRPNAPGGWVSRPYQALFLRPDLN
ncbi:hypothetical protein BH09VER1_BH09VER1_30740 [soil metagenome]